MKHLPLIFVVGLILSACNNDKSNIIINVNMIGENSDSIQKVIDNSLNNDTAKVININIYNNYSLKSEINEVVKPSTQSIDTVKATTNNNSTGVSMYEAARNRKRINNANQTKP